MCECSLSIRCVYHKKNNCLVINVKQQSDRIYVYPMLTKPKGIRFVLSIDLIHLLVSAR